MSERDAGLMGRVAPLVVAGVLVLAGCGGSDGDASTDAARSANPDADDARSGGDRGASESRRGTEIEIGDSEFGQMLFEADGQAIYIFENDGTNETVCYGECARDWPPVLTEENPTAGTGVKRSLLGTVERREGSLQVTYDGQPLYSYANEGPGEVRCHNVNLNGGFWWAVGADGQRLS